MFWGYNSSVPFKSCVDHNVASLEFLEKSPLLGNYRYSLGSPNSAPGASTRGVQPSSGGSNTGFLKVELDSRTF